MADMTIWAAVGSDNWNNRNRTVDAVDDLVDQINNRTNATAEKLGVVEVPSTYLDDGRDDTTKFKDRIFRNAADWIQYEESGVYIQNNDHLLLGHGYTSLGWGDGPLKYVMPDGDEVNGGNQLISAGGYYPARNIGMHELLHPRPVRASHADGSTGVNLADEIFEVSPMATSYTFDSSGTCDTEVCGGSSLIQSCGTGTKPGTLCNNPNDQYTFDQDCPIHVKRLSNCVLNMIDDDLPGHSDR